MRTALCEAAWVAARTRDTYIDAQFRRFMRRFGEVGGKSPIRRRAHVARIIWNVLANGATYQDSAGTTSTAETTARPVSATSSASWRSSASRVTIEPAA